MCVMRRETVLSGYGPRDTRVERPLRTCYYPYNTVHRCNGRSDTKRGLGSLVLP